MKRGRNSLQSLHWSAFTFTFFTFKVSIKYFPSWFFCIFLKNVRWHGVITAELPAPLFTSVKWIHFPRFLNWNLNVKTLKVIALSPTGAGWLLETYQRLRFHRPTGRSVRTLGEDIHLYGNHLCRGTGECLTGNDLHNTGFSFSMSFLSSEFKLCPHEKELNWEQCNQSFCYETQCGVYGLHSKSRPPQV